LYLRIFIRKETPRIIPKHIVEMTATKGRDLGFLASAKYGYKNTVRIFEAEKG